VLTIADRILSRASRPLAAPRIEILGVPGRSRRPTLWASGQTPNLVCQSGAFRDREPRRIRPTTVRPCAIRPRAGPGRLAWLSRSPEADRRKYVAPLAPLDRLVSPRETRTNQRRFGTPLSGERYGSVADYLRPGIRGPDIRHRHPSRQPVLWHNKRATHVHVGGHGDPRFYKFEGPMLRLIIGEKYQLLVPSPRTFSAARMCSASSAPTPQTMGCRVS